MMKLTNVMIVLDFKIYCSNAVVVVELRRVPTWRARSRDFAS